MKKRMKSVFLGIILRTIKINNAILILFVG